MIPLWVAWKLWLRRRRVFARQTADNAAQRVASSYDAVLRDIELPSDYVIHTDW